jgi:hypothetical protein
MLNLNFKTAQNVKNTLSLLKKQTTLSYLKTLPIPIVLLGTSLLFFSCVGFISLIPAVFSAAYLFMMITNYFVITGIKGFPNFSSNQLGDIFFKNKRNIFHTELLLSDNEFCEYEINVENYEMIKDIYVFYMNYTIQKTNNVDELNQLKKVKDMIEFNQLSLKQGKLPEKVQEIIKQNHIQIYHACIKAVKVLYKNKDNLELSNQSIYSFSDKLNELKNEEVKVEQFIDSIKKQIPQTHIVAKPMQHNKTLSL